MYLRTFLTATTGTMVPKSNAYRRKNTAGLYSNETSAIGVPLMFHPMMKCLRVNAKLICSLDRKLLEAVQ